MCKHRYYTRRGASSTPPGGRCSVWESNPSRSTRIHITAQRQTGLTDFGNKAFREPFQILLHCLAAPPKDQNGVHESSPVTFGLNAAAIAPLQGSLSALRGRARASCVAGRAV